MASEETDTETLADLLQREQDQLAQAALIIPHDFSACTYHLGHIRQPVYFCRTCALPRGICAACSVACHHDHDQLELFPKRAFRCDCATEALAHPCSLIRDGKSLVNEKNTYNHNFHLPGHFCRCGRHYDPHTESETMIQCLACEDWFHESCLNLRQSSADIEAQPVEIEDGGSDGDSDTDPSRPPIRLLASDYDSLLCRDCVLAIPILKSWAGTPGLMMLVKKRGADPDHPLWEVIGRQASDESTILPEPGTSGAKRKQPDTGERVEDQLPKKQVKLETGRSDSSCQAPAPNPIAQSVLNAATVNSDQQPEYEAAGDIFLATGFRTKWCTCPQCHPILADHPYLLREEETYEPPEDPDSKLSFEELGLRALHLLPRDKAIDGITAYNQFRDELLGYLRPFAQAGKAVSKEDIQKFFKEKQEARASISTE